VASVIAACAMRVAAHEGPPYPILSNEVAGAYRISLWTDPDTTDDGTPAGQFWVMVDPSGRDTAPVAAMRAQVTIRPLDRPGPELSGWAEPIDGDPSRQFVALLMDHEGTFSVQLLLECDGARAAFESEVEATYDLRPPRALLALYVQPFLLVGVLWTKLLVRRRRAHARPAS
jgi:hypothetical protein